MKHIIIGGVAGGATAAARIRRADENAEIVLVEKGKYISYANCGLPYYIGGVIKSRDKLFVQTPEAFSRRFNVDVRTRHEALSIDTERHEVSIRRADGTTYTETYDRLLLSPGAEPVRPPLEGIDTEGIFTLRNVDDTDRIHSYLGTHRVRHAVVVGGGFIGLEMAENLHHAGAGVSIVEMADQVMAPVDFSIASHVHRHLMDKGVGLWLGRGVERFTSDNGSIKVWLNTGETLSADLVLLSIGLRGYLAQRILLGRGYRRVRNLAGGYKTYSLATQKVEPVEGQPCGQAEDSGAESGDMLRLDACGLQCPGPIMQVKNTVDGMKAGQRIEVRATDPGFARDAESWCRSTGNKFVSKTSEGGYHTVVIEKREACGSAVTPAAGESHDKTFIMFSDSLDRAIATFVLANGAAATGGKVTIFFTFWGLNVIKKRRKPHVEKDIFGRMFAWMLPSDSTCLHLSKMSMLGLGDRLMRHIMRRKNISQLEELMREAVYNGVELIACQMTMDMMGISRDELIDGVTVGGVATYMERAGNSGVNLFI